MKSIHVGPEGAGSALAVVRALLIFTLLAVLNIRVATAGESTMPRPETSAFLDTLQHRSFLYFWECSDPQTGLTPDRYPTLSFASVSATGFALTAYPVGVEHNWISRAQAAERALATLKFFWGAPQDSSLSGSTGYRGFFYHFLDPVTGDRFSDVELSTMDTALLLAGALFCQGYFNKNDAREDSIRGLAEAIYCRADWRWASVRPPTIGHGWTPENGHLKYDWRGYNEAMLVYLLALGSTTHGVLPEAWDAWLAGYRWGEFQGQAHVGFGPLFGHQYTHVWFDFRGLQDSYMKTRKIDYFENSRRAVLAQRSYAMQNPMKWSGYGESLWGLSACDGPVDRELPVRGESRPFHTYWARGASYTAVDDDGTLCPPALAASLPFAPEVVLPAILAIRRTYGDHVFSTYGFLDAMNPTFRFNVPVQHGRVVPEVGWFDTDYLGIDQGPVVAMIENQRTGLIWKTMRKNPHVLRGLKAAGFSGGWLDSLSLGSGK